jgi:uncharacterized protein (DUF58 family)
MRSLFAGFTTRGRAFVAAGAAAAVFGLMLGQRTLLSIGGLLILLPLLSLLAAGRTRYRIRCARQITPPRIPAGQAAGIGIQLHNVSRLPTGLLLAEDTVPYSLGTRPRFILDRIEPGGTRTLSYPLQSDTRGKFAIGPLHMHVADTFGLVRIGSEAAAAGTLVVTPAITSLPRTSLAGTWLGEGGTRASTAAAAGEDDVVPREYRDGDELRRVHWRSTARRGELMVRREEQRWRNRAVLFLDTRATGHVGRGPSSSFEFAVSAAASIGVHLAREGIDGEFVTDAGLAGAPGSFEDVLLDTLAVVTPSRYADLSAGLAQIPRGNSGLLVAILGNLSPEQARQLAAARSSSGGPAMAMLLAVASWLGDRQPQGLGMQTDTSAGILAAAGWRVVTVPADMALSTAWEELCHAQQARPAPGTRSGGPPPGGPSTGGPTAAANGQANGDGRKVTAPPQDSASPSAASARAAR